MLRTVLYSSVRQFSRRKLASRRHSANSGIRNQVKAIGIKENELFENDEEFEDYETDFFNLHKTYDQHKGEMDKMMEKEKYYIVKHKYFKPTKQPNFLTWNDKEQIRYLHQNDPDDWTIDKLSESFPALPDVIKKICKSKYRKNDEQIEIHDKNVQSNWEKFKNGEFKDLPAAVQEHLNKFTNRALNFTRFVNPANEKALKVPEKPVEEGSFSEIIASYEKLKNNNKSEVKESSEEFISDDFDINKLTVKRNTKQITLSQLTDDLKRKKWLNDGDLQQHEELLLQTVGDKKVAVEKNQTAIDEFNAILDITKDTQVSVKVVKNSRDLSHLIYPEKIKIPKKHYKKGHTYKLNDCFYDSDGIFLYRVPGMV